MVIILIGPDKIGKTPLLSLMKEAILDSKPDRDVRLIKIVDVDPSKLSTEELLKRVRQETYKWQEYGDRADFLYDRFPWPDEFVYGPLWNPPRPQQLVDWMELDGELANFTPPVRFVYAHPTVKTPYVEDPHLAKLEIEPSMVMRRYSAFLNCSQNKILLYPQLGLFTKDNAREILRWLDMPL